MRCDAGCGALTDPLEGQWDHTQNALLEAESLLVLPHQQLDSGILFSSSFPPHKLFSSVASYVNDVCNMCKVVFFFLFLPWDSRVRWKFFSTAWKLALLVSVPICSFVPYLPFPLSFSYFFSYPLVIVTVQPLESALNSRATLQTLFSMRWCGLHGAGATKFWSCSWCRFFPRSDDVRGWSCWPIQRSLKLSFKLLTDRCFLHEVLGWSCFPQKQFRVRKMVRTIWILFPVGYIFMCLFLLNYPQALDKRIRNT